MLIDTHAHLDMPDFEKDLNEVLERARHAGVTHIISVGIDLPSSLKALELAKRHDWIYATIGYHPHNADRVDQKIYKKLCQLAPEPKIIAWGEIGLDFYRRYSASEKQVEAFGSQIDLALQFDLPVIIHSRDANNDVFEIIKNRGNQWKGVIHCFSGNYDLAMRFIDMGFSISIPGTVTYPKATQVQDVARRIPLEKMLIETDAPFLSPVPKRGKRNEPQFVTYTAQKIAELRRLDLEDVAHQTTKNAKKLFCIPV